jgi:beta-galactosidase
MQKQNLNHAWQFHLGDPKMRRRFAPDETWSIVDLPHDWSIELERDPNSTNGASNGFFQMGRGYYAKTLPPTEEWRGKKVLIEFEGVYMNAEVWLNENYLGRHPYGYTSFIFDLTPYLVVGEENLIRVKVDNAAQGNSRWYSGSGIYRPVWLYVADPLHVAHWGVSVTTPQVSTEKATVRVQTTLENEHDTTQEVVVFSSIYGPDQQLAAETEQRETVEAGGKQVLTTELAVATPALWSPESPNLYRLETKVQVNGQTVDTATTSFGIRSIEYSAEKGFLLNGESIKMKGGCVHHDNGVMGSASFPRSEERKVELLKASGHNAIRCAHNPPSPSFLDACDRLGMLVMDESFDCWREGKNPYDYHMFFNDWWERDIESMVLRDRNHPSIVVWSVGNEVMERDGRSEGAEIARMLADKVRSIDPTRPITSAICGVWDDKRTWLDTDAVFAHMDIGGYNYQWKEYAKDHERHPERIIFGTETFPLEAFENWQMVLDNNYIIGDFVWTSMDYLGESGIGRMHFDAETKNFLGEYPWHQAYCGDIDLAGFKRPQSYYRDMVWENGEKLYIAVHYPIPEGKEPVITRWGWPDVDANWTWPGKEGQNFKVEVYSRCERVELFLNGKSLGSMPTTRAEMLKATFEVPYEPGELKAVGFDGDTVAAEYVLNTTGAPAGLHLTPDNTTIQAEKNSLCYVTVEVIDREGCMNPTADNTIFFTVKGAGEIAAVGSGNPASAERYRGNQRQAYRGRCVVVVKSTGKAGEIRLRAQADGLESAECVIRTA